MKHSLLALVTCLLVPTGAVCQEWTRPVRGSWVRLDGGRERGDVTLAEGADGCQIVVSPKEHTAVRQAAAFLAADIERISGYKPVILAEPTGERIAIRLVTVGNDALPQGVDRGKLEHRWEAYQILTEGRAVWLVGSNFRGTAFAAYTLSERLGIDPLYQWTGISPEKHSPLVLGKINYSAGPPTFKYRGLFHDDEDILPRPFDDAGYPLVSGTVPRVWYERFFETALRLRMNQVAPYVRVQRPYDIQKMASDWGLFYSSHHYDTLLSNPYGYKRFGLGEARKAGNVWDWFANKEGLLNFWRGGVLENRDLDCIWPVGMRGTEDTSYKFPASMSQEEKNRVFRDVIDAQVSMTKALVPKEKTPVFHLTLFNEMLENYQKGTLDVPEDVIIVWTDDNDGRMRALPQTLGKWKHGVYYHLAFFGGLTNRTKQVTHTVTPMRVAEEFRRIVDAGATEYLLVNVSELREFVMEGRMIGEIGWDASAALTTPDVADRYVGWWSREYFGEKAAGDVAAAYRAYYRLLDGYEKIWYAATIVQEALSALTNKFSGKRFDRASPEIVEALRHRDAMYRDAMETIARATAVMNPEQQQFFDEHVTLGMLVDWRQTQAAIKLIQATEKDDLKVARMLCLDARADLEKLEVEILRAERPPFEGWYRKTWIRTPESPSNVHRSYEQLRAFLAGPGLMR